MQKRDMPKIKKDRVDLGRGRAPLPLLPYPLQLMGLVTLFGEQVENRWPT